MKRSMVAVVAAMVASMGVSAFAAHYDVDPVHTALIYRIKHLQSSYSYGRFDGPTGTFDYDAASPEASTFALSVKVADIDTGNARATAI